MRIGNTHGINDRRILLGAFFLFFALLFSLFVQSDTARSLDGAEESQRVSGEITGVILYQREDLLFIDRTMNDGVRPGMIFDLYGSGKTVRDEAGRAVGSSGEFYGSLLIMKSNPYHSAGRLIEGDPSKIKDHENLRAFLVTRPRVLLAAVLPLAPLPLEENWIETFNEDLEREILSLGGEIRYLPRAVVAARLDETHPHWREERFNTTRAKEYGALLGADYLIEIAPGKESTGITRRLFETQTGDQIFPVSILEEKNAAGVSTVLEDAPALRLVLPSKQTAGDCRFLLRIENLPGGILDARGENGGEGLLLLYPDRIVRLEIQKDGDAAVNVQIVEEIPFSSEGGTSFFQKGFWFEEEREGPRAVLLSGEKLWDVGLDGKLQERDDPFMLLENDVLFRASQEGLLNPRFWPEPLLDVEEADVNADQENEMILLTRRGTIAVLSSTGELMGETKERFAGDGIFSEDLDGDGSAEIYTAVKEDGGYRLLLLHWDSAQKSLKRCMGSALFSSRDMILSGWITTEGETRQGCLLVARNEDASELAVLEVYSFFR